jgi:hypothetical protein
MLVTKELSNFIDVVLFCNCLQNTEQVWVFEVPIGYVAVIINIKWKEDAHYDSVRVPILEFRSGLQELETRMCVK